MPDRIKEMFNRIADRYDLLNSVLSCGIDKKWRQSAVRQIPGDKPITVLDLCAGTLEMTRELLHFNPEARVTALDFSGEMLEQGQKKLSPAMSAQVTCQEGNFFEAALPESNFDAVMCAYGIRNLDQQARALEKIYKILKPGGALVILEFFKPVHFFPRLFHATYGRFIIPWLGRLLSGNRTAYQYLRDSVQLFYSAEAYTSLLNNQGFQKIALKPQSGGISWQVRAVKP